MQFLVRQDNGQHLLRRFRTNTACHINHPWVSIKQQQNQYYNSWCNWSTRKHLIHFIAVVFGVAGLKEYSVVESGIKRAPPASQPNNNVCGLISMKCTANSTSESRKLYAHSSSWAAAPAIPPTTARIMSWCGMHFRGIKINDIPWTRLLLLCVMFLLKRNPSAHTLVMPLCGLVNEGHANRKSMITQHANMILSIN